MSSFTMVSVVDSSPEKMRLKFTMESAEAMGLLHMVGKAVSIDNRNFMVENVEFYVDITARKGYADLVLHGQFSWEKRS